MPVMLERWNDDKMDALAAKVDDLGDQLREQREELREQRDEMREQRKELRSEMREQREELREHRKESSRQQGQTIDRLESIQRGMSLGVAVLSGAYMTGFAALIGLIAVVM